MPDALYQPFPMLGRNRAQLWRYRPDYRRPRHFHSEPEFNLVGRGRGALGVGESAIEVTAGDLCWFAPGQDHVLLDASSDFELFVVALTPELSERVLGTDRVIGTTRLRLPSQILNDLHLLCSAPFKSDDNAVAEQQLGELWRQANALRSTAPDSHPVTRRTLGTLCNRPELGRSALARLVQSDPSEVSRHFHRDMGLTLTAFRTRVKLLRFIALVDQGAVSLMSAALEAGFGSYSQCHRAFTETLAYTPRVFFQKEVRERMRDLFVPQAPTHS